MTTGELEREMVGVIMAWPMAHSWQVSAYVDARCRAAGLLAPCGCPLDRVRIQPEQSASVFNVKLVSSAHTLRDPHGDLSKAVP